LNLAFRMDSIEKKKIGFEGKWNPWKKISVNK